MLQTIPIVNIDHNGDSIIIMRNLKDEPKTWQALNILADTKAGRQELNKYETSSEEHIFISRVSSPGSLAITVRHLRESGHANKNKIRFPTFKEFNNKKIKGYKKGEVSIIAISKENWNNLDSYDLAFVLFHEMKAHVSIELNDQKEEHNVFGNSLYSLGLSLRNDKGELLYKAGSDAWNMLMQLLEVKIKDGNASAENKRDYEEMKNLK